MLHGQQVQVHSMLTTVQLPLGLCCLLGAAARTQPVLHPVLLVEVKVSRCTWPSKLSAPFMTAAAAAAPMYPDPDMWIT